MIRLGKQNEATQFIADNRLEHVFSLWPFNARSEQMPTCWNWTTWLLMGGRGSGKTRAGAEWVKGMALGDPYFTTAAVGRIALVGETYADAREVMVEGESGLLSVHQNEQRPQWISSRRRLEWPNGAVAQVYSSEDPDALRGPQFEIAWCDELAKWNHAEETWNMLQFGLRLGHFPQQIVTTTPRPTTMIKKLLADENTFVSRMSTTDNRSNLASGFFDRIVKIYAGTRLGRQELDGELIDDRTDALWQRDVIEKHRCPKPETLCRTVIAIDPAVTGHAKSDACGIIIVAMGADDRAYVLADETVRGVSPSRWSSRVNELYEKYGADRIVIETNQGGDMAESVLRGANAQMPIKQVKASRGKWLRAEPVAHLYERGLVSHVGPLAELEDEMCDFGLDGLSSGRSPDRLDALVWALTELMLKNETKPRARVL